MNEILPKLENKFEARDNKKYKIKSIVNSIIYDKKAKN